jgi:uncharacterized repeat protein (TIGR03809 family)
MSEQQSPGPLHKVAQKWRDLVERRREHFVELFESGRWKLYFSEEQFLHLLRDVVASSERWAMVAPRPADRIKPVIDEAAAEIAASAAARETATTAPDEPVADIPRRSAA